MARWTIYDKNGNVKAITNGITVGSRTMPELEYSGTWMGETFVTISVKSEQPVNWQIGDYLIYRGEKFVLNYDPSVVKKARRNTYGEGFVYDGVKFNSLNVEMSDVQFLDEVLSDNHIHYTSLPAFSFFAATIDDYADRLQANMNRYCLQNNFVLSEWWLILTPSRTRTVARGAGISGLSTRLGAAWDIAYQDEPSTDGEKFNQNVSISKSTVFAGLANIYNLFGLHYVTSGRTLIIGAAGKIASHVFEYGKGNGLYEIERVADSEQQLVTKLYAYGNSTNLPIRYYSNIAKVCVGKVTGIQRTGNTQLSLDTDLPYQDSYFSNRTGDIIPRALVTIRSHVITIGGGVIKRDNNTVMVSIFLKTSPDDPDWYTTDSQGLATLIQQMQVGDELIFVEGADIDKWPAGHFSYGSAIPNNLAINNLMLPGFPTQSLKAWVLANGGTLNQDDTVTWNGHTAFFSTNELAPYILSPNSAALGVREASKTWDGSDDTEDIYPTIENTGDDILVSADIITDNGVFGDGDEVPNFSVVVKGLGADVELDSLISNSGDAAKISMKDGYCGGREFSVVSAEKVSGSTNWKLTLKRDYDEALQLYFPYSNNASIGQTPVANEAYQLRGADIAGYDGDKFVWLGIDMPSEYIEASAEKLLDAALTFLEANDYARYTYSPKVDEIYMAKQHDAAVASQSSQNPFDSLHDTLHEGNLMQFDDADLLIDGNIFIDKLTIKEYGNGAIPTYDVTLRNHKSVGTYQRLLNTVDSLSGKGGASGIWGNGGVSTSQTKDLIKQEGDKRYIRRDINDETDTDLTANKFIAKEGVKTDTIGGKTGDVLKVEDDLQVNGDGAIGNDLSVGGDLSVAGDTELNGDVTIGNSASDEALIKAIAKVFQQIKSDNYNGDSPFDVGWMIKNADVNHGNASYMVIDNLFVRMKAIFTELEIRKISYAGGNIILSHAGSTLVKVVPLTTTMQPTVVDGKLTISGDLARVENHRLILDSGTVVGNRIILDGSQEVLYAYRCYIKKDDGTTATENWWRADDQARCQTFNIDETGTYHDVSNSFYWRRVMNVGSEVPIGETTDEVMDYVDLSALDCITGSTVPQAGDVIVQMGNRTDVSRQGFISLEVYGDDAPAFKVYKNVNGYTLNNKMPIIISPYNTSIRARRLAIETDYDVQIVPMERGDWSSIDEHKCYYYDQVQHNGSTWLCIFPEEGSGGVMYTTEEPSLEASWWKVIAQAGKDGSDGKSFNILGSYDTMAELVEAHPTGSVGDAYIVAGDLVVWDDENQQWSNSGRIQGETGNGISGATIHYGTSASNTTVPTNWTANYADLPYTQGEWIWTRVVLSYTDGTSANPYYTQARIGVDGSYKSTAFTRSNKQLSATTPTGGDYNNPLPNQQTVQGEVITWSDGIPAGEAIVWATSRVFTPTGASSGWSTPRQMTDTSSNDVEFSANATKPANPSDNESERDAQGWRDVTRNPSFDFTTAIWRAERTKQNGVWSAWVIEKIKGESITKTSEDVKYALSDSGTVAPQSGWQTTKPTSTDTMRWIWTRTIITWSDTSTTTLYQAERDPNDGVDGMEIVVGTQTIKYAVTDNGSSHPSEDSPLWQDTYTPVQGKWLWSKITTPYIYDGGGSAGTTVSYDVSYIAVDGAKGDKGDKGDTGRGISRVDEYYLAGNSSATPPTGTWVTNPNNAGWSATYKYLWNYEDVVYTDGTSAPTTKSVVAIWSKDGKGIDSIVNYYKASSNPNESRPAVDGTDGWTTTIQAISPDAIYLHNYEKITYTDASTPYRSDAHIIGHWGMDALEASQLILSPSLVSIPTDTDGVVLEDFRQEIEVSMKTYSDVLSLKSVDFTANENVVVEASTLIAMAWSGASVSNNRIVNVEGSINNGRLTISADDYAVVPTKIVVKATKGTTLTERTVSITATALDEDGNEYNGYNELTVQRQYIAEDGADGENGEDAINVALSPFAVLFSQDVSSDDDTAAHAITQITPETIASQVVVTKGETPITTGVVVTVAGTSHFNTSGVTIEGTTITLDKDGIQVEEVDMKYYPYDNGYVDLNVAYNGETYPLRLQFYVNLMGKFKTTIEGDVETSIASKHTYYLNSDGTALESEVDQQGTYIRSAEENIQRLDEQVNDPTTGLEHKYSEISQNVNKISLKVGQYYNLFYNAFFGELLAERSPYSPTTSISLVSEGTYGGKVIRMGGGYFNETITSSIMGSDTKGYGVYLDKGTYTFQMYAKVQTSYPSTGFAGVELLWDDNADFSTWSSSKIIQRIQVTETSYSRYTYTFTLTSARYVGFRMILDGISIGGTAFFLYTDAVMLEIGSTASSMVSSYGGNQSGAEVGKVQRKLLATGIDIEDKKITMTADKFECQNNSGVKTAWLDEFGNWITTGVQNNLITKITSANAAQYILDDGNGLFLDVLRCGDFILIESLPSSMIGGAGASNYKYIRLPYFINGGASQRGQTKFLTGVQHSMLSDEMRQLVGRKITIRVVPEYTYTYLNGIANYNYYGTSAVNALRRISNGQKVFDFNNVLWQDYSMIPRVFHIECQHAVLVDGNNNETTHNAYIWTGQSDYFAMTDDGLNWT